MTMEKKPNQNEGEGGYSMERFRGDIGNFAIREATGDIKSGHFLVPGTESREPNPNFDISKLTEEDQEIWEKIKDGTITLESFRKYTDVVGALDEGDPAKASRVTFSEFAANKASRVIFNQAFKKKAS
jgi:hypothetical protein